MIHNVDDGAIGGTEEKRTEDVSEVVCNGEVKWSHGNDNTTQAKEKHRKDNRVNTQGVIYCCHCGNFPVPSHDSFCSVCESLRTTLDDATKTFSKLPGYRHRLSIGMHVEYLHGNDSTDKDKKIKRTLKRQELLNKVAALLNTESGHIIIHLVGRNKEDRYPGAFDEFIDKDLEALINDGRLFNEVYRKRYLSDLSDCVGIKNYSNFLVLTVERSDYVFTSDFKTKCVTDDNILDTKEVTLRRLLRDRRKFQTDHHTPDFEKLEEGNLSLYESREVQLKAIFQNGEGDEWLCGHIFEDLNLLHYVTAFSKNNQGGSYVAGVHEVKKSMPSEHNNNDNKHSKKQYKSKKLEYKSATIKDTENLSLNIKERVKNTCLVCDYEGNFYFVEDLVIITFLPHTKDGEQLKEKYIIIVSVRPVCGLVFFEPEGPVAYMVEEKKADSLVDSIKRLPLDKWFKAMKPE